VGMVQALLNEQNDCGLIQNIGVVPTYRGYGFGRMLLLKVLHAFRCQGMVQAQLEVTMKNHIALNLYYSLGFRQHKIVYREVTPVQGEQLSI
ncbi:MAG: GNAT family N-acetyltransferase, partial [Gemmataceae bacterium]|nr:GNAT family N-acetyltransferase [Gemmataceae bacterium]